MSSFPNLQRQCDREGGGGGRGWGREGGGWGDTVTPMHYWRALDIVMHHIVQCQCHEGSQGARAGEKGCGSDADQLPGILQGYWGFCKGTSDFQIYTASHIVKVDRKGGSIGP